MLSVKHIRLSGYEDIYLATTVTFIPNADPARPASAMAGPPVSTGYVEINGETKIQGGTVFVMNDAGKTVARYDLGASMVPLSVRDGVQVSQSY